MTRDRYLFVAVSVIILIIPDIIYNITAYKDVFSILMIISKACLVVSVGLLCMFVTGSFFWSYLLVGIAYMISLLVETVNVVLLEQYTTVETLKAVLWTTNQEASGFTEKFGIYFLIPGTALVMFLGSLYLAKKKFDFSLPKRNILSFMVIFGLVSVAIPTVDVVASPVLHSGKNIPDYIFKNLFVMQHPFSLYYRTYEMVVTEHKFSKYRQQRESFTFGVSNPRDVAMPEIVVMVIGEGIRYHNWSVNGYAKDTSPHLDTLRNLVSMHKHFTNANVTSTSIPLLITNADPTNPVPAYAEKTLVTLFKESGFETHWIACQNVFYLGNEHEADHMYALYKDSPIESHVIPILKEILQSKRDKNQFVLINLIGNHGKLPPEFADAFRPNSSRGTVAVTSANADILTNDYNNMVLFEDYVLSELIRTLNEKNVSSLLLFTSDHGVNLFDGDNNLLFGYGATHPTARELQIPLFVWGSDQYVKGNAEKLQTLQSNRNKLSTNDNVMCTLADLSNITYRLFTEKSSLASRKFVPDSVVLVSIGHGYIQFQPPREEIAKR